MIGFELTEQERRARNFFREGVVFAVDSTFPVTRYRVGAGDYESDWLIGLVARSGGDRISDHYDIGEQVVFISVAGGDSGGYILGAIPQTKHPEPESTSDKHTRIYGDGAVFRYDREQHHYEISLPESATASIKAKGGVFVTGDLFVTGDVVASGVSLVHHPHGGVVSGQGLTNKPIPGEG